MGNTYARVKEGNDIANFQELTEMILEIEKLIFWKKNWKHKKFLQQCVSLTSLEEEEPNKTHERLKIIRKKLINIENEINEICVNVKDDQYDDLHTKIDMEIDLFRAASVDCKTVLVQNQEIMQSTNELLVKLLKLNKKYMKT